MWPQYSEKIRKQLPGGFIIAFHDHRVEARDTPPLSPEVRCAPQVRDDRGCPVGLGANRRLPGCPVGLGASRRVPLSASPAGVLVSRVEIPLFAKVPRSPATPVVFGPDYLFPLQNCTVVQRFRTWLPK